MNLLFKCLFFVSEKKKRKDSGVDQVLEDYVHGVLDGLDAPPLWPSNLILKIPTHGVQDPGGERHAAFDQEGAGKGDWTYSSDHLLSTWSRYLANSALPPLLSTHQTKTTPDCGCHVKHLHHIIAPPHSCLVITCISALKL